MADQTDVGPVLSFPERVILAEGWTRRAIAFCAGAVGALALAPVDFAPAMFVPLTVAVWLIDGSGAMGRARFAPASLLSAAGAGWWLGFGYFLAGLWWLGAALLVEADQFAWALPLAVLGIPAGLALFTALASPPRGRCGRRARGGCSPSPSASAAPNGCAAIY